ncbi:hypothetical protein [Nocardioides sp. YIM 152588]|uniref:anti-sigma factor family protein n=1 Tax=Nocardioides sp. YIM 152588 TaxID=3158259 RepID=UPI0032E4A85C
MIGHLGPRVSALLDGQMTPAEAEDAWAHVYTCHACRDLVEREGWVKTRLAGLCGDPDATPSSLKGSLMSLTPGEEFLAASAADEHRRGVAAGIALVGGGALSAAMLGALAFGALPGGAAERRPPASQINTVKPTGTPSSRPASLQGPRTPAADVPVWLPFR